MSPPGLTRHITPDSHRIPHARTSSAQTVCTKLCDRRSILTNGADSFFGAKDAYDCLTSAPFNKDIALEFLQYYSDTLQLQSTQSYLKDPPAGYQQPSVDLLGGLEKIKDQAGAGQFKNEYDFEYALQQLILQTHDAHINLAFGILSIFTFGSPYGLVSVSTDGIALPKVFIVGQCSSLTLPTHD